VTRHTIAIEGQPSVLPDIWLSIGSLWMHPDEKVAVTWNFDLSTIVGYAYDLQRNEVTNEVSVEVGLIDGALTNVDLPVNFTFYATELEEERIEATDDIPEHRRILKARIRGIAVVPAPTYPTSSQKLHGT
jgi:hypothetical protein